HVLACEPTNLLTYTTLIRSQAGPRRLNRSGALDARPRRWRIRWRQMAKTAATASPSTNRAPALRVWRKAMAANHKGHTGKRAGGDRKSTRLNSSHVANSYVF